MASLAYFQGSSATSPRYIYYWPFQGLLTRLQFSNNSPNIGVGSIATAGSVPPYTTVNLASPCTPRSTTAPCLNDQLVPGDIVTSGTQSASVLSVGYNTMTVTPGFGATIASPNWTYHGYFIKPAYQNSPKTGSVVEYPGGSVEVTSNKGNGGLAWGLATIQTAPADPPAQACPTLTAMLNAYDAPSLTQLWSSYNTSNPTHCHGPCFAITPPPPTGSCGTPSSTFGLPTIVNGSAFIPTYQITSTVANSHCSYNQPCSGLVVYCGTGTTACNGDWQQSDR